MITCAATHHLGGVIALGCCSSAAILTLMAVVATGGSDHEEGVGTAVDAEQARAVEGLVTELSSGGADEEQLRALVGAAMRLGRGPLAPDSNTSR
jgi:hypothetical protein